MNLGFLSAKLRQPVDAVQPSSVGPQSEPLAIAFESGDFGWLKVDLAARIAGCIVISGWAVGEIHLGIRVNGRSLDYARHQVQREDVAAHFPQEPAHDRGFVLIAQTDDDGAVVLSWTAAGQFGEVNLHISDVMELGDAQNNTLGDARFVLLKRLPIGGVEWRKLLPLPAQSDCSDALGFLEGAVYVVGTELAVVCGWGMNDSPGELWIEADDGRVYPLSNVAWRERPDVLASIGRRYGQDASRPGFVAYLKGFSAASEVTLKALTGRGVQVLHRTACVEIAADPITVSRWMFGIAIDEKDLLAHHELIEEPVLAGLLELDQSRWSSRPTHVHELGKTPVHPRVSLIVPLYGRHDFVESQMIEWVRDTWLIENVELIYVIDDPRLEASFHSYAQELYRLYRVPFKWLWGGVNRGFSGANNIGATEASAPYLLFLNSDVFPRRPGWIAPLVSALDSRSDIGAIGPRLLFAEGGIQHAGMVFERLDGYGVWVNRHPCSGLDPALDPHEDLTTVPAITGACLLLRRRDFDAIGGWDAGYIVGDFEDSDLCLKLRAAGLGVAYLPSVELIHLERQSMALLGDNTYRTRVVLWNAMRHQRRWRDMLNQMAEKHP